VQPQVAALMDGLRGISAIVVAIVHAFQIFLLPYFGLGSPQHVLTSLAATYAIMIFFLVSGFMICLSIFKRRDAHGRFDAFGFAEARVLRIYPPLIFALLITIAVYLAISGLGLHGSETYRLGGELTVVRERATLEWSALPATLLLLHGAVPGAPSPPLMDGPLWTLGYEWWCYILAWATFRLLWNGVSLSTLVPPIAIVSMMLIGANKLFLWFLVIWMAGFVLGYVTKHGQLNSPTAPLVAGGLVIVALACIASSSRGRLVFDLLRPLEGASAQKSMAATGVIFAVAIGLACRLQRRVSVPQFAVGASRYSYTLYVIHYPFLLLSYSVLHPWTHGMHWATAASAAALCLFAVVWVSAWCATVVENRTLLLWVFASRPASGRATFS
jgi:peptidoglycan/LPS O-acetylase OafA/YrhL